jgi:two-component system response regulator GlrR
MREVDSLIDRVADVDTTVLVLGESGTGKEMVARAIHERSGRSAGRFVAINCGALAESVLESELFGHVRGAFTGAVSAHRGLFEEASGSTLFLDEVGELPLATQVKLLRVLQEREIRPVGASESRRVDVRVVGATYRDLAREVERGTFREDLYYRLNVISIMVPPLRERPEDIPALVQHFIKTHARRMGRAVERIERDALELLLRYSWPGNVRELENVIERAIVLARTATIEAVLLPDLVRVQRLDRDSELPDLTDMPLAQAKDAFEHAYLERALARAGGRVADAARTAGLDPSNLRRVLRRHAIDPADFKGPTS